ncbi:glucosaminidase domain-containing protein [Chitinophagaceae bacterium LB-8]|uniref:Peptidoglycan hydrolase n=1 Tax=Paraflavisolibacter caeni TaxID=2982496 RepID=A0A9X2XU79_9BACT|nr:glucosaminidase domain-containing protein [Paraflavisolibacter caeni]MCU7548665.1 glucosaminidase domain-containing protein [Paraflavisolibacter caeni]
MQKLKIYFVLVIALAGKLCIAQPADIIKEYIVKYKELAIEEMKRTGVPASITLAQGVHETFAGQSALVLKSNNHFGIKCKSTWTGESVSHDDDAPGECFRKYADPADSYRDHSDFLKSGARYASLFRLDPTDFEGWAWGLKRAGYATNPKYPQILIKLIRDFQLQDYTLIAMGQKTEGPDVFWVKSETPSSVEQPQIVNAVVKTEVKPEITKAVYPSGLFKINETRVVYVPRGTSYLSIANEHHVPLHRLFDFNDLKPQETADRDQLVYVQRKRKSGSSDYHTVSANETLLDIAQAEGIRLESLLAYNFLKENMQPEAGQALYLRHKAPAMPKLATAIASVSVINTMSNNMVAASAETNNAFLVHVVQPKETVYSISKKYAVSMDDVLKWNELSSVDLKTGQQLRIKKM